MKKGLALDTSSYRLGVAVSVDEEVVGEHLTNIKKNHALRLMPAVEALLNEVDVAPNELDYIAVAKGPGSYTGVRMAATAAKTLAWTLNIPLISISTLTVMAQAGKYFPGVVVPLIDARRNTVFTSVFQQTATDQLSIMEEEKHQSLTELLQTLNEIKEPILFVGEDVAKFKQLISEVLGERASYVDSMLASVRPGELCLLASHAFPEEHVHQFVPEYLRLPEAEVNWRDAQERRSKR